jgi:RNase P/RNase MRP subunit POP5
MSKRYFLVRVIFDKPISGQHLVELINASIAKYFGEMGTASINPQFISYNPNAEAIVACQKCMSNQLLTALTFVQETDGMPISLLVVRVSGTIRSLSKPNK